MKSVLKYICILFLSISAGLYAQTGLVFSTTTEVTALNYNGSWSPANHTTQSLDLIDWGAQKSNSVDIEAHEIVASSAGFNSYLAGLKYTPDISHISNKTNIPSDNLVVFLQGAAGTSTLNNANNKFTFIAGAGAQYRLTSSLAWSTIDFRYGQVGPKRSLEGSTGLIYFFNPQASHSLTVKRFMAKRTKTVEPTATK
jgi:opacity protein-like surface antigen